MKIYFLSLLSMLMVLISCKKDIDKPSQNTVSPNENRGGYEGTMTEIQHKTLDEKKKYFFTYIDKDVPEFWSGTSWSFNGTAKNPGEKSVACGYFVTNVLGNYGFKIKSDYLAQQASSVMIKQLCSNIRHFTSVEKMEKYLESQPDKAVYIVGLDFHTGFVTRDGAETYFIHSSYIKNKGPVKEKTSTSQALHASKTFMVGQVGFDFLK